MSESQNGLLIIISGPSGSGKSTIVEHLIKKSDNFYYSISATTRPIKNDEVNGVHYHFMTHDEFQKLIDNNEFLEYKPYSSGFYGTMKSKVLEQLETGKDVVLDIEVQGALDIMDKYPKAVSIWLLPPNYSTLKQRLYDRKRDTPEEIENRLKISKEEMKCFYEYDYIVVNNDGEQEEAANEIMDIIKSEKIKLKQNNAYKITDEELAQINKCEKYKTENNDKFYNNFNT